MRISRDMRGTAAGKIVMLAGLSLLAGACGSGDRTAPVTEQKRVLSKGDSLWLANDYAELGFDRYSYEEYDSGLVYFELALQFNPLHSQAWHGRALRQLRTVIALDSSYAIGVRTEDCWAMYWDDPDFLETVGASK